MPSSASLKELRQIGLFGRLAEALIAAESLPEFVHFMRESLAEIIPADQVLIFLHDLDAKSFILSLDLNPADFLKNGRKYQLTYDETIFSRFLKSRVPVHRVMQPNLVPFKENERSVFGKEINADMAIPIRAQNGDLLGVLHFSRKNPIGFNRAQRAFATAAAAFIANLLDRDRLASETRHLQEREKWWRIHFEALFTKSAGPCCLLDTTTGFIVQANEQLAQLLKRNLDDLQGIAFTEIFAESDRQKIEQAIHLLSDSNAARLRNLRLPTTEGNSPKIHLQLTPIEHSSHVFIGFSDNRLKNRQQIRHLAFWQRLNTIFSVWQTTPSDENFKTAIEDGLQRIGESLGAKYVMLCKIRNNRINILHALKLNALQHGQLSQAWRAGIAQGPYAELLKKNQMTYVQNIQESDLFRRWQPIARQLGYSGFLAVPLEIQGEVAGLVNFYFAAKKKKLRKVERKFVSACAHFLSMVLTKQRLHCLAQQRFEQIKVIQELTNSINANLELEEVIRAAAFGTSKIMAFDLMDVSLFESDGENVRLYSIISRRLGEKLGIQAWHGFAKMPEFGWLSMGEGSDPSLHDRIEDMVETKRNVLLMSNDKYLGTMEVSAIEANAYHQEDVEFLDQVAGQLATAIENTRLFNKLSLRVKELSAIARASWAVAGEIDIQSMITNVLQSIVKAIFAKATLFQLFQRLPDIPEQIDVGDPAIQLDWQNLPDIREKILSQKHYATIENYRAIFPTKNLDGALLLCPVILRQQAIGLIKVEWDHPRRISRREIELVRTMANLTATSIKNEMLRQESVDRTAQLEQVNEELEKFVYTVSHDLRSPIVSIQGFSSILVDDYADSLDDDAKHYLERIQKNAFGMEQLVKDLLELSHVGRVSSQMESVKAREVIDRALVEYSYQIKEKGIEIQLQEELPEIYGDATQFSQVFANLIGNAIKFMDSKKPEHRIEIGARPEESHVLFWVKDNGVGIAHAYHERIFNLFERYPKGKSIEGTGIGLTIVKRIIDNYKGRIWVESKEGEGATFYFTFPTRLQESTQQNPL